MSEPPKSEERQRPPDKAWAPMLVKGAPSDRIEVAALLTVGRESAMDVCLDDATVSRKHATLGPGPAGEIIVTDLKSASGSFVNGHRFESHVLTIGDRLRIGPFYFHFDGHALTRVENATGGTICAAKAFFRFGKNTILDDIRLTIPSSRFVGIIGPSGAGKSSLLTMHSGLRRPESGTAFVDGRDIYSGREAHSLGFVPQEDIVHGDLPSPKHCITAPTCAFPRERQGSKLKD